MDSKKSKTRNWMSSFYNYLHSQSKERMKFAVRKLHNLIIAEGIAYNLLTRYQNPATNPYSPPYNTPENYNIRKFLEFHDFKMIREKSEKSLVNPQEFVHLRSMKAEPYKLAFKYVERWMQKTKLKSKLVLQQSQIEELTKHRLLNAEPPVGSGEAIGICLCAPSKSLKIVRFLSEDSLAFVQRNTKTIVQQETDEKELINCYGNEV